MESKRISDAKHVQSDRHSKRIRIDDERRPRTSSVGSVITRRKPTGTRTARATQSLRYPSKRQEKGALGPSASRDRTSPEITSYEAVEATKGNLAKEDAEILALEKKLGLRKKQTLPKSFKDDGLDELLEGLDSDEDDHSRSDDDTQDWLDQKRSRTIVAGTAQVSSPSATRTSNLMVEEWEPVSSDLNEHLEVQLQSSKESWNHNPKHSEVNSSARLDRAHAKRENPYLPPALAADAETKYVPPKLRDSNLVSEDLQRLEKQLRGLINRLTEANMVSLLDEVEKLYRSNPRQHVTSTLTDLLIIPICVPTALPDTLIMLSAGFIAAIYKVIGIEFGARIIQRLVDLFKTYYARFSKSDDFFYCKEASNLMALLSELYNFQVIGSKLLFDYIRTFLATLSEAQVEILQRILRIAGPQMRQDDPESLKEIVVTLRQVVAKLPKEHLSVRARFMIESIEDLRSNRMKSATASSTVSSEHASRIKKTLGSLNNRTLRATEPLRCGMQDISQSDSSGRWWLVGTSWAGKSDDNEAIDPAQPVVSETPNASVEKGPDQVFGADLAQLARQQNMNTDVRRAIFISIMSATDFRDAHMKLLKLRLKKSQELEIPKVLMSCCGAETRYNPYYTVIAKKLCEDRKMRVAFRFGLWDLFKQIGEPTVADGGLSDDTIVASLDTSRLVNLAKMFGTLIADQALDLLILKTVNLGQLSSSTTTFVEVMLVTAMLRSQGSSTDHRDEERTQVMFSALAESSHTMSGMLYFIKRVIARSDIAGDRNDAAEVKRLSRLAIKQIRNMLTMNTKYVEA